MKSFNQADARVVAALHRLNAPEMRPLLEFFQNQLADTQTALLSADTETFRRLQGRGGYIKELLDAVENAALVLEKLHP